MSYHQPIGRVDDYTDAFLTTLFVIFFMGFWMIAAAFGYIWVVITAYGLNRFFKWIGRYRSG